jgi:hypothetical protein
MRILIAFIVTLIAGCGGATTTENEPGDAAAPTNVCGTMSESGVNCLSCVASKCCAELTACTNDPDGVSYETCMANCATSHDAGACEASCADSHRTGAASCSAYHDCFAQRCFAVDCH